jgi:DNA invertase Pin-like site-specific DNA recombinase
MSPRPQTTSREGTTTVTTYQDVPAYARLSRKSKGGRIESVPLQFATLDRMAEWGGHTIGARFDDKALSAWDQTVYRAGWEAFLAELDTGRHRAAASYHADRLSRNGMDAERLLAIGERHGIMLLTPEGIYDLGNADSRAMFRHLAAMTINQSDATSRRARNHKNEARRQGNLRIVYGGTPPLGFRQGDDDWEVDPAQAAWLTELAETVLADPEHRIETAWAAAPPIADTTGRPVSVKMARNALKRPASAGLVTTTEGEIVSRAPQGGPLDEATWNRLAVVFGTRKRGRPVKVNSYPFGPVLRCGKCGNQLTGDTVNYRGTKRPYYSCKNPHKALGVTRPCHGVSVPAEDVHDLIEDAVMAWAETPAAKAAAARAPETAGRRAELDATIEDLADQLADLDGKRLRMPSARARARYADLAAEAERMIAGAEAELLELAKVEQQGGVPVVINWAELTPAEKVRTLSEAVQTPIIVQPGTGGGAALSAADRIDLVPLGVTA